MKHVLTVMNGKHPLILEMHASKKGQNQAQQRFKVSYGLDVARNLSYYDAAQQFGFCYFHMLACEGKFNQENV